MLRSSMCELGPPGSQPNQTTASTVTMVHIGMPQGTCGLACCTAHAWGLSFPVTLIASPLCCYLRLSMQELCHEPAAAIEN